MAACAIVGLGNPGRRYERTRHNAGFMVADELARRCGANWKSPLGAPGRTAVCRVRGREVILFKPQTFMNDSGRAVAWLVRKRRLRLEDVLVVYDDVALALGRIRLRPAGGAGGHKGMMSIIEHVGDDSFPRLRVGIAGAHMAEAADLADYVLSPFAEEELSVVGEVIGKAADAAELFVAEGIEAAMNRFNASGPSL